MIYLNNNKISIHIDDKKQVFAPVSYNKITVAPPPAPPKKEEKKKNE